MLKRPQSSQAGRQSAREGQIRRLQLENARLQDELALETERACDQSSLETLSEIACLQEEYGKCKARLARDQESIAELQSRIDQMRKEVADLRRQDQSSAPKLSRQIRISENRLDKALVRYNEAIAFNINLRESIETLRREWMVYNGTFKRIESELKQKREQMALITQQTVQASKARNAAQAKLADIKHQTDKEKEKFTKLSQELHQKLKEHRQFMDDCLTGRPNLSLMPSRAIVEDDEEQDLKKKVADLDRELVDKASVISSETEAVQQLESSLQEILDATGIASVDDLVSTMQISEATNQSLYKSVNEISTETIFELERELDRTKRRSASLAQERASGPETSRARLIDELQSELSDTLANTDLEEAKLRQIRSELTGLKPILTDILDRLGIEFDYPLNENHFAEAMGIIENKMYTIIRRMRNRDEDIDIFLDNDKPVTISISHLPSVESQDEKDVESSDEAMTSSSSPVAISDIRRASLKSRGVTREASVPNFERLVERKYPRTKSLV